MRRMSQFTKSIIFGAIALTAQMAPAYAGLDTTFGTGGKVSADFYGYANYCYANMVDSQGRILAAGRATDPTNSDFAIVRYLSDGSLDTTFGTGGKVTLVGTPQSGGFSSILEQSDGKYVAVGTYDPVDAKPTAILARFNADGSLDTTYGTGGTTLVNAKNLTAIAAVLDSQERVVFTGRFRDSIFVARYTNAGLPDTTFSGDGIKRTPQADGSASAGRAIGVDSRGRIIVAGFVSPTSGPGSWVVQRYRKGGSLDTTFNTTGQIVLGGSTSVANALAINSDNSIFVGGNYRTTPISSAVAHILADGTLDTSFGTSGLTVVDPKPGFYGVSSIWALKLDANGNLVTVGSIAYDAAGGQFVAMRFSQAGVLDTSFGTSGFDFVKFGTSSNYSTSVAIQDDGKIVGGGYYLEAGKTYFANFRLNP